MITVGVVTEDNSYSLLLLPEKDYQLTDKTYAIARTAYHEYEVEVDVDDIAFPGLCDIVLESNSVTLFTKNGIKVFNIDDDKKVIQYDLSVDEGSDDEERNVKSSAYEFLGE